MSWRLPARSAQRSSTRWAESSSRPALCVHQQSAVMPNIVHQQSRQCCENCMLLAVCSYCAV